MNKPAIQKFAIWARNELISQVSQRAYQYGIDEKNCDASLEAVGGRLLSAEEKSQRRELVRQIEAKGYTQVMEEVAYTWFNRFIALRFMEVNNYLPSHIRVFSDASGAFKPEILSDALHVDLPGLDTAKVAEYIEANDTETLYRYLLLTQCNALNKALPMMFERMGGYTEMLLPNNILKPDGVLGRMVADIPEDDWRDAVQIIGWLYQYYNTELKDDTFAQLKKNVKISKERIPAATQLFTPDWIVRYMVENSLGRLWFEGHPNDALKADWKYYLDDAEQEPDVETQLEKLRAEYRTIKLEEIKVIDPCMGSGHILVYAFDVLMQIYEAQGVTQREAAQSILQNNLYGLDIDQRAAQLAYFAVMMKARQYDRRLLTRGIQPNLYHPGSYEEGREFGSILQVDTLEPAPEQTENLFEAAYEEAKMKWNFRRLLAQKYDVVVTNPPYMGASGMSAKLSEFVKKNYPDSKSDLFACFMERGNDMAKPHGFNCMVTMQSWMFLSSFEKMRTKLLRTKNITNLMHMENMVMGIAFGTAVTVMQNAHINAYKGTYNQIKLQDIENGVPKEFPVSGNRFAQVSTDNFSKIPGSPVAYWVSEAVYHAYTLYPALGDIAAPRKGNSTSDNNRFLRLWHEIDIDTINFGCEKITREISLIRRWFPYNKGGGYRKWYGFNDYVIDWYDDAAAIRSIKTAVIANYQYFMEPGLTWSTLTSGNFSIRKFGKGFIFDNGGCCIFNLAEKSSFILGLLNSNVFKYIFGQLNPTLNFQSGEVAKFPIIYNESAEINALVNRNVSLSIEEYNSFETSWDFKKNPLI